MLYTFSEPVTLDPSDAFSIAVASGQSGTAPTLSWAAISPDASGASAQWAVSFSGAGVEGGSIADGLYDLTWNTLAVTSEANPTVAAQPHQPDLFFRLFGDALGAGRVNLPDYNALLSTYGLGSGDSGFIPCLDVNADGQIDSTDYNAFEANYARRFTGTISFSPTDAEPTNVIATADSPTSVALSWTAPATGTVSGYDIQQWSAEDGAWTPIAQNISASTTSYTDTTVEPDMTYQYQVMAQETSGNSDWSETPAEVVTPPSMPASLTAIAASPTEIDLAWITNDLNAASIEVDRSDDGLNFYPLASLAPSVNAYSDTGLADGTHYWYQVFTIDSDGTSSAPASADAWTPPAAPSDLMVAGTGSSEIDLSWTDNSVASPSFSIQRSTDGVSFSPIGTAASGVTAYADTAVSLGISYTYQVVAVGGDGSASDPSNAVTAAASLQAPSNLTAAFVSGDQINLNWTNNSTAATYNAIEQSSDGINWTEIDGVDGSSTSNSVAGPFDPSTLYYLRVHAYDADGNDLGFSNAAAVTTPAFPAAPSDLAATAVSDSQINLAWTDNSTNETGFKVERSTDDVNWTLIATTAASATAYSDTGLSENTAYSYRVIATNAAGDSSSVTAFDVYTLAKAPSGLAATFVSGGQINLSWTDNSLVASSYSIEQSSNGATWAQVGSVFGSNATSYTATGPFNPSATYYFRVRADAYGGYSTPSNVAIVSTPAFPAAPSGLTAVAASDSQINLNWQDNSSDEAGFKVERSTDDSTWTLLATTAANATSYSDAGLNDGTLYYYRVCASNANGDSNFTAVASAQVPYAVPTVATPASAGQSIVTGTTDTLSVLGAVPGGQESSLIYLWSMTSGPAGVSFSPNYYNAAKNTTVTFSAAGNYTFQVQIGNGPMSITSSVQVTVNQTLTSITVTPSPAPAILPGATQQFTAVVYDQFGMPMSPAPTISWSVGSGGGTIDQTGLFTAPTQQGPVTVQASSGGISSQTQATVNQGIYQVTLTGRAYEPGYDASGATDGLSVTNPNWIVAPSPEDAVRQAISGTVTLNTDYDEGDSTLSFPADLGSDFGFAILGSDNEGAGNKLTWDAANSRYTGAIGMWDGDTGAPADWDFYWNVSVVPKPTVDLGIDADNNDGLGLPDHSAAEEVIEEDPTQWGKDVPVDDGTFIAADYTPVTLDLSGVDPSSGTVSFNYGSEFNLYAPSGSLISPGQTYSPSALGFTGVALQEVVLKLDAVAPTMTPQDGTITVAVNAASAGVSPVYLADAVQANGQQFQVEQVGFGSTDGTSFHAVRMDPTPTDFTPQVMDTVQWEDLNHNGIGGDTGERNAPICYTRSGENGNVIMTMHVNLYVAGGNATGAYEVKAQVTAQDEGTFHFNPVAATAGTLNNGLTGKQDTVVTADLTGSDFIIPSVIAKEDYKFNYFVSSDGGKTWQSAGQSDTITYVINGSLPTAWTYNSQKDSQTGQADTNTNPLWTVLDISCRACQGQNLAADPDDPWTGTG